MRPVRSPANRLTRVSNVIAWFRTGRPSNPELRGPPVEQLKEEGMDVLRGMLQRLEADPAGLASGYKRL